MEWITKIKEHFFYSVIKQRGGFEKQNRKLTNFESATSFGIIYNSTPPDNDIIITKTAEFLRGKGKKVTILGYLDDKEITHKGDIQIFNKKEINWYGVPLSDAVDSFCNQPFDVLIYPHPTSVLPLDYVAYCSKALCRVGVYSEKENMPFELMVKESETQSLTKVFHSIISLLNQIKL